MDPDRALKLLEGIDNGATDYTASIRHYPNIYNKRGVDESFDPLFWPSVGLNTCAKVAKRAKKSRNTENHSSTSKLKLNMEFINGFCENIEFPIFPTEGCLKHLDESIELFKSCLSELPNFTVNYDSLSAKNDLGEVFDALVESLFQFLDSEKAHEVQLNEECTDDSAIQCYLDVENALLYGNEKEIVKEQLRAVILWCNWSLQLASYAYTALQIAKGDIKNNSNVILETALGLKESNRNMIFYGQVSCQLGKLLRMKDSALDLLLCNFFNEVAFLKQVISLDKHFEPKSWIKLQNQMEVVHEEENILSIDEPDGCGKAINQIRREMRERVLSKGNCERLAKECDLVSQELSLLSSRQQEISKRLDSLYKQMQDTLTVFQSEPRDFEKISESKKLPHLLFHLLEKLYMLNFLNPMREIAFKVLKEDRFLLQMSILAPKDMPFPNQEAVSYAFPLVLVFDCVSENFRVTQRIASDGLPEHAALQPLLAKGGTREADENDKEHDEFGLGNFCASMELTAQFKERLENCYREGQQSVWDIYLFESYKKNNNGNISALMPPELRTSRHTSQYTYLEVRKKYSLQ